MYNKNAFIMYYECRLRTVYYNVHESLTRYSTEKQLWFKNIHTYNNASK